MRVETKDGGDGVRCWNTQAIQRYADRIDERELHLTQHNPDLRVTPGRLLCYGCEVMEYDYGTKCTAQLTRTCYSVNGEVAPRSEDAAGSLLEIEGFVTRVQAQTEATSPATVRVPSQTDGSEPKRAGLRALFSRTGP